MASWLRRIRAAVGMGLIWGVGWAIVGGAVMEGIVDPHGKILDMWPQTLAIPGFLCGAVFSVLLGIAASGRRFDELSLPRFGALGAGTGLLLGVLAAATGPASLPLWLRAAVVIAPLTILSAASATASLALARLAERRALRTPGADHADVRLTGGGD
jgi:hypothetical protein